MFSFWPRVLGHLRDQNSGIQFLDDFSHLLFLKEGYLALSISWR